MDQENQSRLTKLLHAVIMKQLDEGGSTWFSEQVHTISTEGFGRKFYMAFSAAPRFTGKQPLSVVEKELATFQSIRTEIRPDTWNIDQAVRIYFLLLLSGTSAEQHKASIMDLFDTSDMGEQAAIFSALPLLPYPEQYRELAAEGVRTNMILVLESIGHYNPYPADYLEDNAWNQLFLKCVFTGRALYKIIGIERRANEELARIISDYAHERWSAGREVTPEIWRPVPPFFQDRHLEDMQKLFKHPDTLQQFAAALTCSETSHSGAKALLETHYELTEKVISSEMDWIKLGREWEAKELA